jgi:hypothetical protein
MVAPLLQAQVDINAPGRESLGADLRFSADARLESPCRWMKPFGPLRAGTRTLNLNRRNRILWTTTCTVSK